MFATIKNLLKETDQIRACLHDLVTNSLPPHVDRYLTRWLKVSDGGTWTNAPSVESFRREIASGFETRDITVKLEAPVIGLPYPELDSFM